MSLLAVVCSVSLHAASGDLAAAAQQGNWARVRTILDTGLDPGLGLDEEVHFEQADGMTSLHWAVQANEEQVVTELLSAGADPNASNRYGITPLWLAATNGSAAVARLLLAAGADLATSLPHGETALMAAARTGEPETVRLLIQAGANPDAQETSQGESALMWAAAENHPEVIGILIEGGADPDLHGKALDLAPMKWMQVGMVSTVLPSGGFTAAMYAARQNAQDAIRALAEEGADLDAQDPDGATALQLAIINQHYDLAAQLLELGADPNVADNTGMTAVYAAVDMHTFRSDIGRPSRRLVDKSNALDVLRLSLQLGGDPNAPLHKAIIGRHHGFGDFALGEGATALIRAAKSVDLEALRMLLDNGADASLAMANGSNAVMLLAGTRVGPDPEAADDLVASLRLLAGHGADLNAVSGRGETALHAAARLGSDAVVRALVELGADLDATDKDGNTALDLVLKPGSTRHEDTETLLRELVAERSTPR